MLRHSLLLIAAKLVWIVEHWLILWRNEVEKKEENFKNLYIGMRTLSNVTLICLHHIITRMTIA